MNENNIDFERARKDIEKYVVTFLRNEFELELKIPVKMNGRLTRALGQFVHTKYGKKSLELAFAKDLIRHYEMEEIIGVIKHECVHYALYELNKPYDDGDEYFENYLKKVNAHATGVLKEKRPFHRYQCNTCTNTFAKRNKVDGNDYYCKDCGKDSSYKYLGRK